ncbi:hypothetical protein FA15DRAFT_693794 [Coprinopsis marcescibilis]|uniref:Nephrocystin 3-like N-terminal domain-containing protein n=1 Tax=Coprinopsis marcescibilis TaxID=230819 RepID=A0A5C3L013_COPMA|nr:hypothetical protein FA15DRAFT_693794 [Coprinopsis marcescibilis]
MHKFKLLHRTVKGWKSGREDIRTGREVSSTGPSVLTGASNVTLQDSQVNVNQTNITNNINTDLEINEALRRLPDPVGCSWNPSRACLEGTRMLHIQEVARWETAPDFTSAGVYVVAEPVGSGKSSLAHTISKNAHKEGNLVAAFFFDQVNQHSNPSNMMASLVHGLCEVSDAVKHQIGNILAKDKSLAKADPVRQFEEIIIPICPILPQDRRFVVVIDSLDEEHDPIVVEILRDWVPRLPASFRIFVTTRPETRIMEELDKQSHIQLSSNPLTGPTNRTDIVLFLNTWFSKTKYGTSISPELLDAFITKSEGLFLWATVVLHHIGTSFSPAEELKDIIAGSSEHWAEADGAVKQLDSLYERILSKLKLGTDRRFMQKYKTIMGALVTLKEPLSATGLAALYAPDGITLDDIHRICGVLRPLLRNYSEDDLQSPIHLVHLSVQEYLTGRAPLEYRLSCQEHDTILSRLCLHAIKHRLSPQNVPILGYSDGEWFRDITQDPPTIPQLSKKDVPEQIWYACNHVEAHTWSSNPNMDGAHARLGLHVFVKEPRSLLEATAAMGNLIGIVSLRDKALALGHDASMDPTLKRETAAMYSALARSLVLQNELSSALQIIANAGSLYRELHFEAEEDVALAEEFAVALDTLSTAELHYGSLNRAVRAADEALKVVRPIAAIKPATFQPLLSRLLRIQSRMLSPGNLHERAFKMAQEHVQVSRQLAADNAAKFEEHLALSLSNLHQVYVVLENTEGAIPPIAEVVQIYRQLALNVPEKFDDALADILEKFLQFLSMAGRHADAIEQGLELVPILRSRLAKEASKPLQLRLGIVLDMMAYDLFKCGRAEQAISTIIESVVIYRRLGARDNTYQYRLRSALHSHVAYLTLVGRHLEATEPTQEAVAIYRRESGARHASYDEALADSLLDFAGELGGRKRLNEAETAYMDAINILLRLSQTDPETYESKVAESLSNYALLLSCAAKYPESLEELRKVLAIYNRLALKDPDSFRENLGRLISAMAKSIDNLGNRKYDQAVCTYVTGLIELHRNAVSKHPESLRSEFATSLFKHGCQLGHHRKNREAIEAIKEVISIQRRLAEQANSSFQEYELALTLNDYVWHLMRATDPFDDPICHAEEAVTIFRLSLAKNPKDDNLRYGFAGILDTLARAFNLSQRYGDAIMAAEEGLTICRQLEEEQKLKDGLANHLGNILHQRLAEALFDLGRHAEALSHIQEAVALGRTLVEEWANLGWYTDELAEGLLLLEKIKNHLEPST